MSVVVHHAPCDAQFAAKLAHHLELRRFAVQCAVWSPTSPLSAAGAMKDARWLCIVIPEGTALHAAAHAVLTGAKTAHTNGSGPRVVPIVLSRGVLPPWLHNLKAARFGEDHSVGLRELMLTLGAVTVRAGAAAGFEVAFARRVLPHRVEVASALGLGPTSEVFSPLACVTAHGTWGMYAAVVECLGDWRHAGLAGNLFNEFFTDWLTRVGLGATTEYATQLIVALGRRLAEHGDEHGLRGRRRLGMKLGLLFKIGGRCWYVGVGATSLLVRREIDSGEVAIVRQSPRARVQFKAMRGQLSQVGLAPIGWLDEHDVEITPIEIALGPRDVAVVTSFLLPEVEALEDAGIEIAMRPAVADVARATVSACRPRELEALACAVRVD